jgi:hypothetical protein
VDAGHDMRALHVFSDRELHDELMRRARVPGDDDPAGLGDLPADAWAGPAAGAEHRDDADAEIAAIGKLRGSRSHSAARREAGTGRSRSASRRPMKSSVCASGGPRLRNCGPNVKRAVPSDARSGSCMPIARRVWSDFRREVHFGLRRNGRPFRHRATLLAPPYL